MIDKLIDQIKEKIPFLNKDEEYEDEDTTSVNSTLTGTSLDSDISTKGLGLTKSRKTSVRDYDDDDDEDDEDDDEDEDDASAKRGKLIRIFAAVAVVYFGVTEFVLKEEAPPPVAKPVVAKKKVNTKQNKKTAIDLNNNKEVVPDKKVQKVQKVQKVKKDPIQKKVVESVDKEESEKPIAITKEEAQVEIKPVEIKPVEMDKDIKSEIANLEQSFNDDFNKIDEPVGQELKDSEELKSSQNSEVSASEANEVTQEQSFNQDLSGKIDSDQSTLEGQLDKITQKIIEEEKQEVKLEFVEAPNYENFGRGLVYNCKGKHWACVDKPSYIQCRQHFAWSVQNSKTSRCVTAPVYSTISDCRKMQLYKINKVEIPDCK